MPNAMIVSPTITDAGLVANRYASQQAFADYRLRKSANTLRAHKADLATFADYICASGVTGCPTGDELQSRPEAWLGVTWGYVQAFVNWMLGQGLAVTSVNRKLSTVKVYAKLAAKADTIDKHELTMINAVTGFSAKEFNRVNEKRSALGTKTRQSTKKVINVSITVEQAKQLKEQPNTPQGRRDALIMCLLLDHGLRVGELAKMQVTNIDLAKGEIVFYRDKVQKSQRHAMTPDTFQALRAWAKSGDMPSTGYLLRQSNKAGVLGRAGITERSLGVRVRELGERIRIKGLGPHDCRHYWATRAISKGTDPFALLQAGGWTSMQTVQKYVDESKIANEGVKL
ncbi:site-specific tyrosine recombinase XerD [soil metagenome]